MTTQLTTSNLQGSSTGPEVTGANPPANFPDESTIARLANEFFFSSAKLKQFDFSIGP